MSLFPQTGRDANLPILTQIGAINEQDEAEVLAFLQKLTGEQYHREENARVDRILESIQVNPEPLPPKESALPDDERRFIREAARWNAAAGNLALRVNMADYMALVQVVKRILTKRAKGVLQATDIDIERFDQWLLSPPDSFRSVARITAQKGVSYREGEHIYAAGAKSIMDALVEFMQESPGKTEAQICPACCNPFVANLKKGQKACSHKCNSRLTRKRASGKIK